MARNKLLLRQITLLSKVPIFTPVFDFCFCFCAFLFLFKHIFTIAKNPPKVNKCLFNIFGYFSQLLPRFCLKFVYFHVVFFTT